VSIIVFIDEYGQPITREYIPAETATIFADIVHADFVGAE
jgi:hypothetical protein